ncbi:type 2 isopentenyl-diphosphate Delta-isomerase [Salipaludibacillus agaradhaerens]|uniref:type 2 isopentenyl-diphosphate Delta-isomerase n=1 Tax=Salipaludibacillus agaradhaerens TaxID=76935 RepID=UPI0023EE7A6B|nr:type 2 isopentenyl-diphosphate Delta-isomerase [Salipaludibacillus agaradhaerens]
MKVKGENLSRAKRKIDHIEYAMQVGQTRASGLDDITFLHRSFPDTIVNQISLSTKVGELQFSSPIYINAMTGGGGRKTEKINRQLAQIANVLNIPMAVGSQMSAVKDKSEQPSYKVVRQYHPRGLVFANVGSEATVDEALFCISMLEADALQIHMNVIQELVMPEGDRDFKGALKRVESIIKAIDIPVIVKEVGFGMSRETVKQLYNIGVSYVDVGGFGGTNFSLIENSRRTRQMNFFDHWGIPTAVSVAETAVYNDDTLDLTIFASGGIQNALDIAKVIALGANAAGLAGTVLKWVKDDGVDRTIDNLNSLLTDLKFIMAAVGAETITDLKKSPIIISGATREWLIERGIDTTVFANRG